MKSTLNFRNFIMPIGMLLTTVAIIASQKTDWPDLLKGGLFGIAIGVLALPIFVRKTKCNL